MRIRRGTTLIAAVLAGLVIGATAVSHHGGKPLLPGPAQRQARAEDTLHVVLPSVQFRTTPLAQALEELRKRTGATFVIDWDALEGGGVSRNDPVDLTLTRVTLEQALKAVLGYAGCGGDRVTPQFTLFDGAVVVTTPDGAGDYVYAAVYDLSVIEPFAVEASEPLGLSTLANTGVGLFGNMPNVPATPPRVETDEELTRLIEDVVEGWVENVGTGGTVRTFGGRVVAVTTWQNHRQIRALVAQLRNPSR